MSTEDGDRRARERDLEDRERFAIRKEEAAMAAEERALEQELRRVEGDVEDAERSIAREVRREHWGRDPELAVTGGEHDRGSWERRWSQALREHGDRVAQRPPNAHLTAELAGLPPGRALDAGCGHGAEALWLAARGWQVTAVDFAATALAHARSTADTMGRDVADRVEWIEGDLGVWTPERGGYDLVACLYVHVAGAVEEMVRRMAAGVAPRGTLFLVGHRPVDPATGAQTAAAGQVQVSVGAARAALETRTWELLVAEERPRPVAGTGVDAVIRARRRA
jgi:2-polyprenyl-3-methyl-5-hydroxy-6-metoxy-1,4-benzoquinol methylase